MDIAKQRHAQTDEAIVAIAKEQNQKWNTIASMFEKKYGVSVLARDWFRNFFFTRIPNARFHWDGLPRSLL
jgi:adenosine deaminase